MFILFSKQIGCRDSSGCISFQRARVAEQYDFPEGGPACCRVCYKDPQRNLEEQSELLPHPLVIAGEI